MGLLDWLSTDNMIRIGLIVLVGPTLLGIVLLVLALAWAGLKRLAGGQ